MTAPTPSQVRVVQVYSTAPTLELSGITAINLLSWPVKHPLDADWYWVNATGLCQDLNDTIAQVGVAVVTGDDCLMIPMVAISDDDLQAGFMITQGTPGVTYTVRAHLTFTQGTMFAVDILLPVNAHAPVPLPNPAFVTNNDDIMLLGGIPFPTGN
jgi:hypothetical protein